MRETVTLHMTDLGGLAAKHQTGLEAENRARNRQTESEKHKIGQRVQSRKQKAQKLRKGTGVAHRRCRINVHHTCQKSDSHGPGILLNCWVGI